ncbi:MAG: hypothetical protein L6461_04225 [Anaerolineae bacterium]|nr:hypothetical protein [Anaerolineae bacterium]
MNIKRTMKLSFLLLAVMVLTMAIYGFAAANTVPASQAGDGNGAVSGYTVSAIHYVLNTTTPANVSQLTFTVAPAVPAGGSVYITLTGTNALNISRSCTVAGTAVTCDFTSGPAVTVPVVDILDLRVIAAQ